VKGESDTGVVIMAARTPEDHLTWYVINYYGGLMTREEWLALRNFQVDYKVRGGYARTRSKVFAAAMRGFVADA
jgi:hypothetical protein